MLRVVALAAAGYGVLAAVVVTESFLHVDPLAGPLPATGLAVLGTAAIVVPGLAASLAAARAPRTVAGQRILPRMRFRAALQLNGKTATGIVVPAEIVAGLGPGKRHAVTVTIGGYTYRSTVSPYGGAYMLSVSAENRRGAGIAAGDEVDVDLEPDTAPRVITIPADLAASLGPEARAFFDSLSYSHQRAYVDWIEGAKKAETRQSRVEKAAAMLAEGRTRV